MATTKTNKTAAKAAKPFRRILPKAAAHPCLGALTGRTSNASPSTSRITRSPIPSCFRRGAGIRIPFELPTFTTFTSTGCTSSSRNKKYLLRIHILPYRHHLDTTTSTQRVEFAFIGGGNSEELCIPRISGTAAARFFRPVCSKERGKPLKSAAQNATMLQNQNIFPKFPS